MNLKVDNRPNTQQLQTIPTNGMRPTLYQQKVSAAQNGTIYLRPDFGRTQLPIYVHPDSTHRLSYGAQLPNNQPPMNLQQLPIYQTEDEGPPPNRGIQWGQSPQLNRGVGSIFQLPLIPLRKPLKTFGA